MDEIQIMADGDFNEDDLKVEFFYLSGVNMGCPIDGCNGSHFASKAKYQRHWDEKHVSYVVSHSCPFRDCRTSCGRRTDLKCHLKNVHRETDGLRLKDLLSKTTKRLRNNKNFIDPGLLVYKGRTKVIQTSTSSSTVSAPSSVVSSAPPSTVACTTLSPVFQVRIPAKLPPATQQPPVTQSMMDVSITPDTTPSSLTSRISVEEYKARRVGLEVTDCPPAFVTHLGCTSTTSSSSFTTHSTSSSPAESRAVVTRTPSPLMPSSTSVALDSGLRVEPVAAPSSLSNTYLGCPLLPTLPYQTQDSGTQTSCLDYQLISLPPIPENRRELEAHLRWLCGCIDVIGRQREAAKERLEEMRKEGSQLEKEREFRKKVEAENKRLKSELAEMKWRQELFKETES